VFKDGEGRSIEVLNEGNSCLNILKVIVGKLLPVQLCEVAREVAEENSLLMWVLSIA
jgi:hypothetical protein